MDYSTLAARLFKMEEWQAVVAVLADMETEAVNTLRETHEDRAVYTLQVLEQLRYKFREIAADKGLDNPFARRNYS